MDDDLRPDGPRRPPRPRPNDDPIWTEEPMPATVPRAARRAPQPAASTPTSPRRGPGPLVAAFAVGALLAGGSVWFLTGTDDEQVAAAPEPTTATTAAAPSTTAEAPAEVAAPTTAPPAPTTTAPPPPAGTPDWSAVVDGLGQIQIPSDCTLPLGEAISMPGSERSYRGGVHEGIDFICGVRGRDAVAAMDGRVLMDNDAFEDPRPEDRVAVLDVARALGDTPPWTLAMLFGRFVVLDHGVVPGVGHVVTIYAHLETIDPAVRPGAQVRAGDRLGEIGSRGTESAGTGEVRPQAIHLHWEIHVDDRYLGEGLSAGETSALYARLFGV